MIRRAYGDGAFSLVEVVIALGIASFALLTIMALLPTGIKSNQVSVQETEASGMLTTLAADLRNTHPLAASGKSLLFGLPLPYAQSLGQTTANTTLSTNTLYTIGLDNTEKPISLTSTPPPTFQISVIYINIPQLAVAGSTAPIEARLIVNWPAKNTQDVSDLVNLSKVTKYVESYVTFPMP